MKSQYFQSQYILNKVFENEKKVLRTTLNTSQDYLNAVYDQSKDAIRVNLEGGMLPMVDDVSKLPESASDGQICPVYNAEKGIVEFYMWSESNSIWKYIGSTISGNALNDDEKAAVEWATEHLDQLKEVADYDYIANVEDIVLESTEKIIVQGQEQNPDDDLNGDDDETTPYRIDINGYVLSVSTYADNDAPLPDRCYPRITYEATGGGLGTSHIFFEQEDYEYFMSLNEGKNVIRVYYLTNSKSSPVRSTNITVNGDGTVTDADGNTQAVLDDSDTDGDEDTMYCISAFGYVLGIETYADVDSKVPNKCYVKLVYESDGVYAGHTRIYLDKEVYDLCSSEEMIEAGKNTIKIYYLHTVFPASVTISETQYKFPSDGIQYIVLDASGNVKNVSDSDDKDGDESTHVRISVSGYALDMDGYYTENDTVKKRLIVKMSYNESSDTTNIYLDKEHYDYVCSLGNNRNIVSIYTLGAGIGVDASRIPQGDSSKVHIWKGRLDAVEDLNNVVNPSNGDTYQIGDKEYSWNDYEWVELGYCVSPSEVLEHPINHSSNANLTVDAGKCYRWTVGDGVNGILSFNGTPGTMSWTCIDIDLSETGSVSGSNVVMLESLMPGYVNRCVIDFDGETPRLSLKTYWLKE